MKQEQYEQVPICKEYYEGTLNKYGLYESKVSDVLNAYLNTKGIHSIEKTTLTGWTLKNLGLMIVLSNWLVRRLFTHILAPIVKFKEKTKERRFIQYGIFSVSFVNACVIYLIAPWDSREIQIPYVNRFLQGIYTDLNSQWFLDIGRIIFQSMFFDIFTPIILFLRSWAKRHCKRVRDQRSPLALFCLPCALCIPKCYNQCNTHSKTMQKFVKLYSGPQFTIHSKYAGIMNIIFLFM